MRFLVAKANSRSPALLVIVRNLLFSGTPPTPASMCIRGLRCHTTALPRHTIQAASIKSSNMSMPSFSSSTDQHLVSRRACGTVADVPKSLTASSADTPILAALKQACVPQQHLKPLSQARGCPGIKQLSPEYEHTRACPHR